MPRPLVERQGLQFGLGRHDFAQVFQGGARFTALHALLGRLPQDAELDTALIEGFTRAFEVQLVPGRRNAWEQQRVEQLRCWKYLSTAWTYEGKPGAVERERAPRGLFR